MDKDRIIDLVMNPVNFTLGFVSIMTFILWFFDRQYATFWFVISTVTLSVFWILSLINKE